MQLSLRSQLIAGVAAVGLTAVAVAPIAQPELSTSQMSGAVNLVAVVNPVAVLLGTVDDVAFNIFDQASVPPPDELYWPDAFYTPDFSFLFAPGYWGAIPDFVNQFSNGALSAVLSNLSGYISATSYGLTGLVSGATSAIWNTPFALVTALGYLAAGQIDQALAELQTQILGPIVQGISDVAQAVGYIVDNSIANAATVISNTIPGLLANVIGTVIGGATYVVESALATLSGVVTDLVSLQLEDAWNGAVNGLLGVDGTLGQIENLLVGVGIIEDVEYEEGVVPTVTIPSLRSDLTSASQRLGDLGSYGDGGIRNDSFVPEAIEAAAAVLPSQAAATGVDSTAAESAAEVEVTAAEEPAEGASEAPAAEPATEATTVDVARPVAGDQATDGGSAGAAGVTAGSGADTAGADETVPAAEKAAPSKQQATRGGRTGG
ncbi:MAG: hypothetical protein QG655_5 [Actinomycetota bacterium]|jgi:hypothetical protein|nr:hypothetical protein [Actinomycetota bacterium]